MKNLTSALTAMAVGLGLFAATSARAAIEENSFIDYTGDMVYYPCVNGGDGEMVMFEGSVHMLITLTYDRSGGFHGKMFSQAQGLQAVGLSTGENYQAAGAYMAQWNGRIGETYTYSNIFRLIGQGTGIVFVVQEFYHITVSANGEVAVEHDSSNVECL